MAEALFELFIPLLVANIVDVGIANGDTSYILKQCGIMVLLGFVGLACSITAQYFSAKAAVGMAAGLRRELFAHIGKLSYAETDRIGTSTLLSRTTADVNQIQTGTNLTLRLFLRSPLVVFGAMAMAFIVDLRAAISFLAVIPALAVVVFGIMLVSMPLYARVQKALSRVLRRTRENLGGVRVVRAFCHEDEEVESFHGENEFLTKCQSMSNNNSHNR